MSDDILQDEVLKAALEDSETLFDVSDEALGSIAEAAERQIALENLADTLKDLTTRCNKALEDVRDRVLPNKMLEAGAKRFDLASGAEVKLQKMYLPSIKKEDEAKVFAWMMKEGHGPLVNADMVIHCGKGGMLEADLVREKFVEVFPRYDNEAQVQCNIHWQTLRAFVREQLEAGNKLPPELKVHEIDRAKVTVPKKKAVSKKEKKE